MTDRLVELDAAERKWQADYIRERVKAQDLVCAVDALLAAEQKEGA